MISIIITAFKEPKLGKAIESFITQNIKEDYELFVIAPDKETINIAKSYQKKNKKIKILIDPGKGKSYALNHFLPKIKGRILILTDGDVYVSDNSVNLIIDAFQEKSVGCVTGRPVSINNKNNLLGYWSHLLCDSADYLRKRRAKKNEFLECSGYYWAFRNNVIKNFPLDVAEDSIVPYMFAEKGFKIKYIQDAKVFVKFPTTMKDFIEQKKRTAKAHTKLDIYANTKKIPKMKTLSSEIKGSFFVLSYPGSIKEFFYTLALFPVRLYIWILVFYHTKLKNEHYTDAWKRVETTK